jgi:uncharacterized protein (DUF934 family)
MRILKMSVIVTDAGFAQDDWDCGFRTNEDVPANDCSQGIDLASDTDPTTLNGLLNAPMIRIDFPSFADGRGFTLATRLRGLGYKGRMRAKGHVISDQYAMARRSGFDEVEISDDLAARQPEAEWLARANWQANDYQTRLRG